MNNYMTRVRMTLQTVSDVEEIVNAPIFHSLHHFSIVQYPILRVIFLAKALLYANNDNIIDKQWVLIYFTCSTTGNL